MYKNSGAIQILLTGRYIRYMYFNSRGLLECYNYGRLVHIVITLKFKSISNNTEYNIFASDIAAACK